MLWRPFQRLATATAALLTLALPAAAAPAFWRVSDADSSVYLFGSIHAFDRELDWRGAEFDRQLREADHVYFEVLFDDNLLAQFTRAIIADGPLKDGRRLNDLLSADQLETVQAAIADSNMSFASFERARPWVVEYLLTGATMAQEYPGVEALVTGEIEPERLRAFETFDQQVAFFSSHSEAEQVANLMETIALAQAPGGALGGIVTDWFEADLEALEALASSFNPARYRTLVADRNERWAKTISELLADNDKSLVIVGIAHLVGENGVPSLLAGLGFKVERVDAQ
jgi:uncharacterized protein